MSEFKQQLIIQELAKAGLRNAFYKPEANAVQVNLGGNRSTTIFDNGDMLFAAEHRNVAMDTLKTVVDRINESAAVWERSKPMKFEGISNFRLLAEYNNTVLAARDDTQKGQGLHFVTWEYNSAHTAVNHGHYTQDYDCAKQDFAIRSGLIHNQNIFTQGQSVGIKNAVGYTAKSCFRQRLFRTKKIREIFSFNTIRRKLKAVKHIVATAKRTT